MRISDWSSDVCSSDLLTAWQKVQVARHPDRPHAADAIAHLVEDFPPLAGARGYADDAAIVGGLGRFRGRSVVVMGTEKGATTETRVRRTFRTVSPAGARKAPRMRQTAHRYRLPTPP